MEQTPGLPKSCNLRIEVFRACERVQRRWSKACAWLKNDTRVCVNGEGLGSTPKRGWRRSDKGSEYRNEIAEGREWDWKRQISNNRGQHLKSFRKHSSVQQYPSLLRLWDWEKIKSANCYQPIAGIFFENESRFQPWYNFRLAGLKCTAALLQEARTSSKRLE